MRGIIFLGVQPGLLSWHSRLREWLKENEDQLPVPKALVEEILK
jgi:hypothetical protein